MTHEIETIHRLLVITSDDWYEAIEGTYTSLPTWGPRTPEVDSRIAASCADGDIVSWDTTAADVADHLYLMRRWTPAADTQQEFRIERHADAFRNPEATR